MPFCCKCGHAVTDDDIFCASCGTRQNATAPSAATQYISGVSPRTAALLCYIPIIGWIAAVIVLATTRFRTNHIVRFHAFQGLYLFVVWLIIDWVVSPFLDVGWGWGPHFRHDVFPGLLRLVVFGSWIFMMVKVSQDNNFKLPVLGELAEKSVHEQQ